MKCLTCGTECTPNYDDYHAGKELYVLKPIKPRCEECKWLRDDKDGGGMWCEMPGKGKGDVFISYVNKDFGCVLFEKFEKKEE